MRWAPTAVLFVACSFDPTPLAPGVHADAGALQLDAPPMMAGDPCATDNGGCAVACMDNGGSAACFAPQNCGQVVGLTNDSNATLYVGGSATKPWTAYCHDGLEYLPVSSTTNYGEYAAGVKSPGSDVRTEYGKLRIDPATLEIDVCDQAFGSSSGSLSHDPANNNPPIIVSSMPLGVAMDCKGGGSTTAGAGIDLSGTPFVATSGWQDGGNSADGATAKTGRVVTITGGGDCGWDAPAGSPGNPFNTFSNSKLVQLSYSP
ncbi:MAG TPA: hypothetical protein VH143_32245 [Kofleriaceae bacterium]|jgi:hypothetical protein|nr:hypothetical protein [Kofleriaceae bacterium]